MKTFQIRNGDFVIGAGGFQTIVGPEKVRQELGFALKEPYGVDRFHPRWGSLLLNYIGSPVSSTTQLLIESEVSRVIQNYVAIQNDVLQRARLNGTKTRFGTGEVIQSIKGIDVVQEYDKFSVRIALVTLSQGEISLTSTVRG